MQSIAVLILFYNKLNQTIECINSFVPTGLKIYVLNNGSDEISAITLRNLYSGNSQIKIFDEKKNLGVSGGRNYLINVTSEKWLFHVDNDIIISNPMQFVNIINSYITSFGFVDAFIPVIYNKHENAYANYYQLSYSDKNLVEIETKEDLINNFPGGASIVSRSLFEKIGYYDENMFVGFEDVELSIRAIVVYNRPLICKKVSEVELIHDHKLAINEADLKSIKLRYNSKLIGSSFNYLRKKHSLNFDHNWQWWTKQQLSLMEYPSEINLLSVIKQKLKIRSLKVINYIFGKL
jgi:GT2 family glycosyltransferase